MTTLNAEDCRHLVTKKFPESQVPSEFDLPSNELALVSTHTFALAELPLVAASTSSESLDE